MGEVCHVWGFPEMGTKTWQRRLPCLRPEKRRPLARAAERQLTARCVNGLSRAAQISAWAERELELAAHGGQVGP